MLVHKISLFLPTSGQSWCGSDQWKNDKTMLVKAAEFSFAASNASYIAGIIIGIEQLTDDNYA